MSCGNKWTLNIWLIISYGSKQSLFQRQVQEKWYLLRHKREYIPLYPSLMKSCSVIGLHSVTWPNITLLWCWWCWKQSADGKNVLYRDDIDGIMHYSINVVIDMRSINVFSSIVCEKCYRYRPHSALCKTLHACTQCVHCAVLAVLCNRAYKNGGPVWFCRGKFKSTNSYDKIWSYSWQRSESLAQ